MQDLPTRISRSEIVLAGRFRERFDQADTNGKKAVDTERFYASVLVITRYKNHSALLDVINVGTFFTPPSPSAEGLGCLDAFYRNSKYVFFLNKRSDETNFYELTSNPMRFTESLDRTVYAQLCPDCFAPRVGQMNNHQMEHGARLTITCSVTGKPLPEVTWAKNGKFLNLADKSLSVEIIKVTEQQIEAILEISNLIRIDSGEYECLASNPLGKASGLFNLRVDPPDIHGPVRMAESELIPCAEENRDYCLNGGQCYMLKSDRDVLQCRCSQQYFGDRCHFYIGDLLAYAETRDAELESMLKEMAHEVITHLSWSIWGAFLLISLLLIYLILKGNMTCLSSKNKNRNANRQRRNKNSQGSPHTPLVAVSQGSSLSHSETTFRNDPLKSNFLSVNQKGKPEWISYTIPSFETYLGAPDSSESCYRDQSLVRSGHARLHSKESQSVAGLARNLYDCAQLQSGSGKCIGDVMSAGAGLFDHRFMYQPIHIDMNSKDSAPIQQPLL